MPGTVNDFISRFGGSQTMDDREAEQIYDRFASTDPNDREFDNDTMYQGATEYLGQLPDNDFQNAAQNAFTRVPPNQQQSLISSLLGGLTSRGASLPSLQQQLGLSSVAPGQMGPSEYARLANYARRNHPEVIQRQVQEQPGFLKLMGNPVVLGILGVVAGKMLGRNRRAPGASNPLGSLVGSMFRK